MIYPPKKRLRDSLQKAAAETAVEYYERCIKGEAGPLPPHDSPDVRKPGTTPGYLHLQDILSPR